MQLRVMMVGFTLVTVAGCARVGPAVAPAPEAAEQPGEITTSAFSGIATLGGRRLRLVLRLETDPRGRGTGYLEIPDMSLFAEGAVRWTGEDLDLELGYGGDCSGTIRIRAESGSGVGTWEGTLSAKDCTGEESGQVSLARSTFTSGNRPQPLRVESRALRPYF